ncbi:MAG TPA: flagellar assembly protein FliX [Rhizomicrobium sp.]|nr:flagellar assembly protein FliX [Rhizomicrobium sp.]
MEIKGSGRIESAGIRRVNKGATGSDSTFSVSSSSGNAPTAVAAPGPLTALDSILTLQGMDDSLSGRSKGLQHGEHLLDMLDQVRDGLLAGGIPRSTLNRLAVAVGRRHESFADPKLQNVLDEIELRAHVELAKLEMMDRRVA